MGFIRQLAEQWGESDYENYWERTFEHNLSKDMFREGLSVQSGADARAGHRGGIRGCARRLLLQPYP